MCTDPTGKMWIADFGLGWVQQFTTAGVVAERSADRGTLHDR